MVPATVLAAFGAEGEPELLAGGQGGTWRSGDRVFKKSAYPAVCEWIGKLLSSLPQSGFRIPKQFRATDGQFVHDSWTCSGFVEGFTPKGTHFAERLRASQELHASLSGVAKPGALDGRTDVWAVAHAVVFDGRPWEPHPAVAPTLEFLGSMRREVALPEQVVHGDISGNFLLSPDDDPTIIDFTPYWAPSGFGEAVLVADAVVWEGMELATLFNQVAHIPEIDQLLVRAASRRLLEYDGHFKAGAPFSSSIVWQEPYQRFAEGLKALLG